MSNFNFRGISVSTAGDVNGDGLDDLIVGAHGAQQSSLLACHRLHQQRIFHYHWCL
jgi:hypothetical protein